METLYCTKVKKQIAIDKLCNSCTKVDLTLKRVFGTDPYKVCNCRQKLYTYLLLHLDTTIKPRYFEDVQMIDGKEANLRYMFLFNNLTVTLPIRYSVYQLIKIRRLILLFLGIV